MEYNDYPESIDESVVQSLNTQYAQSDDAHVMSEFSSNIKVVKLGAIFNNLLHDFDVIIDTLTQVKKYDKAHASLLDKSIENTQQNKDMLTSYSSASNLSKPLPKFRRFSALCKLYFDTELDVISTLANLSAAYSENNTPLYQLLQERISIFKKLFDLYTW